MRHHGATSVIGRVIEELTEMYDEYIKDPSAGEDMKIIKQPRLFAKIKEYYSIKNKYDWAPRDYAWLQFNKELEQFYDEVREFLVFVDVLSEEDELIKDLLNFQHDMIIVPSYDPDEGKHTTYECNWPRRFFGDKVLEQCRVSVHCTDKVMGIYGDPLRRGDLPAFAKAVIGSFHSTGTRFRFHHQPEQMKVTLEPCVSPSLALHRVPGRST